MIQVFAYLFSVEVDAIVCPKHKLCFKYQNTGNKTKLTAMVRSKRLVHSPASQALIQNNNKPCYVCSKPWSGFHKNC